ncbi:MAG: chemotaxis protein CheA, partial [Gammaproteobacteria bacterium]
VDLETQPDDVDLLNAVFRAFHTIKGGAGFLAIEALVDVCHKAENVFDILRRGERSVDAELMDSVLAVTDVVTVMFQQISHGEDPAPADAGLIEKLKCLSVPQTEKPDPVTSGSETSVAGETEVSGERQDTAENRTAENPVAGPNKELPATSSNDEITDDEFEALLDQLHGEGTHTGVPVNEPAAAGAQPEEPASGPAGQSDDITEDEFEALLDELQKEKNGVLAVPQVKADSNVNTETGNIPAGNEKAGTSPAKKNTGKPAPPQKTVQPKAETTVRVETNTLDRIMNMVGELVLLRNRLSNLEIEIGHDEMTNTVGNLDVVTADLQASVMKTRMQPIKKVFGRFPRVVRDLARSLNKEVVLEMIGEDTDLDKNLVEALADPLIHLVRNSIDHGIEMPDTREAAGKTRQGTVVLSAEQEGDHILLTIADDGAGIDAEVLRRKLVEKEIMDEEAAARLDESDCYNLIFMPGFSTKEEISDVSGRGVGMDVVKTRINQFNGIVSIDSKIGKGTTITIKVPLTLAIMPTLMVVLGQRHQVFALPLVNVNEILDLDMNRINVIDGQQVIIVRGKPLPLFYLTHWLINGAREFNGNKGHVVVVNIGTQHIGFLVDNLLGREEVVIKPLGALLHGTKGLAGATITGDGKIALILDLPSLIQRYANNF